MSLDGNCDKHDWSWDPSDDYGCPVCYGAELERDRIINVLREQACDCTAYCDKIDVHLPALVALIKGKQK